MSRYTANGNPGHVSIEDRPGSVESRGEFGHWEMDTVVSGGMKRVRSITTDNGTEFSDRNLMVEALRSSRRTLEIYYTHAYTAWEKGSA